MATSDQPRSWRKSSYSSGQGGNCVEISNDLEALRDSKNQDGPRLAFGAHGALAALVQAVKAGTLA